jgi:hypothetical protein
MKKNDCAVEAIKFAKNVKMGIDGLTFLTLWLEGDVARIMSLWPDCPSNVFVSESVGISVEPINVDFKFKNADLPDLLNKKVEISSFVINNIKIIVAIDISAAEVFVLKQIAI